MFLLAGYILSNQSDRTPTHSTGVLSENGMRGTYSAKNKAGETIMTVEVEYASDSMEQYIKISKNGNSVFGDELKRVPHPMPLWLQIRRQEQRYGLIMTASKR